MSHRVCFCSWGIRVSGGCTQVCQWRGVWGLFLGWAEARLWHAELRQSGQKVCQRFHWPVDPWQEDGIRSPRWHHQVWSGKAPLSLLYFPLSWQYQLLKCNKWLWWWFDEDDIHKDTQLSLITARMCSSQRWEVHGTVVGRAAAWQRCCCHPVRFVLWRDLQRQQDVCKFSRKQGRHLTANEVQLIKCLIPVNFKNIDLYVKTIIVKLSFAQMSTDTWRS